MTARGLASGLASQLASQLAGSGGGGGAVSFDTDALAYIAAVESADTQSLEAGVKVAYNDFIVGCKDDGIWDAIKASCILAGARTLDGCLVPLKGTAPTNNGPFVSGDYNRETGLVGNGSTKYLDSNRNNNADPQNSKHLSVWRSTASSVDGGLIGSAVGTGHSHLYTGFSNFIERCNGIGAHQVPLTTHPGAVFYGISRSDSSKFSVRIGGTNYLPVLASEAPASQLIRVFEMAGRTNARLAFYSIGESLDLALLDTRVTALMTAIGAAIP
jgi:hypothetical protein